MASDTTTLVLDGVVPGDLYSKAMVSFDGLIDALSQEISKEEKIEWLIDELIFEPDESHARAKATLRGSADHTDAVERVVKAYSTVGKALEEQKEIPYSALVKRRAEDLVSLLNGKISSIRFETREEEYTVSTQLPKVPHLRSPAAFGAIKGRVEALSRRKGLRVTLHDVLFDQAISCYFDSDQHEIVQNVWGKRVFVDGWVSRDPLTGQPTSIRHIRRIVPLDEVRPGRYLEAQGILSAYAGGITPEDAIRQSRDGW